MDWSTAGVAQPSIEWKSGPLSNRERPVVTRMLDGHGFQLASSTSLLFPVAAFDAPL
jgi:hypothetical protein